MDHLMSIDHCTVPEIDGSSGRTLIHTVHLNDFGENVTNHRTTIADWFFSMAISVFRFSSTVDGPKWNYDLMEKLIFLLSLLGKLLLPSCVMDIWQHESEETKKKKKWIRAELRDPSIRTSTTMMSRRTKGRRRHSSGFGSCFISGGGSAAAAIQWNDRVVFYRIPNIHVGINPSQSECGLNSNWKCEWEVEQDIDGGESIVYVIIIIIVNYAEQSPSPFGGRVVDAKEGT